MNDKIILLCNNVMCKKIVRTCELSSGIPDLIRSRKRDLLRSEEPIESVRILILKFLPLFCGEKNPTINVNPFF